MKTKKIIATLLAGILAATAAVSASAATLTNDDADGSTEVTAKIEGAGPGDVSYIITIPDKVDFGTLTQPEENADSYVYTDFDVEATEMNINNNQGVSVWVKDKTSEDGFILTQKDTEDPFTLSYDAYCDADNASINDENREDYTPLNDNEPGDYGYHLVSFIGPDTEGDTQKVTLALNQKEIYGKDLDTIAGDYSGTMTFHSSLLTYGG